MEDRAEAELLPTVQEFRALHERHGAQLLALLEKAGGRPENTGSTMGAVHEAVAAARDWFGVLDASAIDAIIDGEIQVLDRYNASLKESTEMGEIHDVIVQQRNEIEKVIAAAKARLNK